MSYEYKFLSALLLTLVIEIPILVLFIHYFYKQKALKVYKTILVGTVNTALTLPYLWFVLPSYIA
jgi:hypothetical protein